MQIAMVIKQTEWLTLCKAFVTETKYVFLKHYIRNKQADFSKRMKPVFHPKTQGYNCVGNIHKLTVKNLLDDL